MPIPVEIEIELGVPIPGPILPPEKWVKTALKKLPPPGPLDWEALFGRRAPRVVDLGCGNGRFVIGSAWQRPHMDHIGTDILPVVIRYATKRANQRGLSNARFAVCGGCEFLERYVAPGSIDELHVYHPQPYGDPGKIEHRLITPSFLARVHTALVPGGLFVIQTDNPAYWGYIAKYSRRFFDVHEQKGPWFDTPRGRTRREIMAMQKDLPIFRAWGTPLPGLTAESLAALAAEIPAPCFDADIRVRLGRPGQRKRR